ncbi:MAG: PTS transporter subunit EIIC [Bifidobacteriaceae bacterium]|jgi:PTS system sucrose-specific IIC component|nr:PTS transporter subunit EIIC [Bifidobacteriaceae bacterium]
MTNQNHEIAKLIYQKIGGVENVAKVYFCMTRVRIKVRDYAKVNVAELKSIEGVLGVVEDAETIQAVVGPGKSNKIAEIMAEMAGVKVGEDIASNNANSASANNADNLKSDAEIAAAKAKEVQAQVKQKQKPSRIKSALKVISAVFVPLIPGMVGAGLIAGIGSVISNIMTAGTISGEPWITIVTLTTLVQKSFFTYLVIFCGINAAKEFGGSPVIGGIVGSLVLLNGITDKNPIMNLFDGQPLQAGYGGIIAVLFAVWISSMLEKWFRKWVPDSIDILITPLLVLVIMTGVQLMFIMPLAGLFSAGLVYVINWVLNVGGAFSGFILGSCFLPMVMLGLHQILTPIHLQMIDSQGMTPLLPVLAMAGAGQVGAAIALAIRCHKNKELMRLVKGALPVGFLGVGEPLIYGVTLPLGKPFITACLGGGIGGAVVGALGGVGSVAIGPSGLALIPLIADGKWLSYIFGLLAGYAGGFILTYFFGTPEDAKNAK